MYIAKCQTFYTCNFTLVKPRRRCWLNYTKNDHTKPRPAGTEPALRRRSRLRRRLAPLLATAAPAHLRAGVYPL